MSSEEGFLPTGPGSPRDNRGVAPFGQLGRQGGRRPDGLANNFLGKARGEGIDRLHRRHAVCLARLQYVIRVRHLRAAAEHLQLPGHHNIRAGGKNAQQVIRAGMKEDKLNSAAIVAAEYPIWLPLSTSRLVLAHPELQGGDAPGFGLCDLRPVAAVDQTTRQVPTKIDHLRTGELREQLFEPGTHSRKLGDCLKKRK